MPVLGNASTAVLDGATSPYLVSRVVTDLIIAGALADLSEIWHSYTALVA